MNWIDEAKKAADLEKEARKVASEQAEERRRLEKEAKVAKDIADIINMVGQSSLDTITETLIVVSNNGAIVSDMYLGLGDSEEEAWGSYETTKGWGDSYSDVTEPGPGLCWSIEYPEVRIKTTLRLYPRRTAMVLKGGWFRKDKESVVWKGVCSIDGLSSHFDPVDLEKNIKLWLVKKLSE